MKKTVTVQDNSNRHNKYINIPKKMSDELELKKGDILLLSMEENKIIMEKC
jgi:AbrB family looped-hinge helix DNA binding protein